MKNCCLLAVLFVACCCAEVTAGQFAPCGKQEVSVYDYWPWTPGSVHAGKEFGWAPVSKRHITESLGPGDGAPIRVRWDGKWLDYYRETDAGLERYKDFDLTAKTYGEYFPPAIQYPRCFGLGKPYLRKSKRVDRANSDNRVLSEKDEEMTYIPVKFEDISVGGKTFKESLMQIRDYKDVGAGGVEHRKMVVTWNAKGIGPVRGCVTEFLGNKVVENFCLELYGGVAK